MKKIFLLAILCITFLASTTITKAQFEGIRFGANVWGQFGSDADMKKVAEFYDMLVFGKNAYSWVLKSRNWNPDAIILFAIR